jgi:hypothetical protein
LTLRLSLDCKFPEGETVKADPTFSSCDRSADTNDRFHLALLAVSDQRQWLGTAVSGR